MGPVVVGTPKQIADTFEEWIEDTDIDGFNLAYAITPGTFKDFVDLVIPELQQRGVVKKNMKKELCGKNCLAKASPVYRKTILELNIEI